MKPYLSISLIVIYLLFFKAKAATFYIDPNYKGLSKGTMQQPYKDWDQLTWKNGNSYLFKKGTVYNIDISLRAEANNITIGAYGTGNRPKIVSSEGASGRIFDLGGLTNVTIKDIEIQSLNKAETCLHFFKSERATVENCVISGSQWGIRNAFSSGKFKISNCEIFNTSDDGVFIMDTDTVEIEKSHIYDVNQNYKINTSETFSGGDCVQLVTVAYFIIRNNKLDHSSNGNKFCFISSTKKSEIVPSGIIEGNEFIRDSKSDGGDLIYLIGSDKVEISNNLFFYGDHAIYNHSINLKVYKNLFARQHQMAVYDEPKHVSESSFYNNTFVDLPEGINSVSSSLNAKNNIFFKIKNSSFAGSSTFLSENNCFYPEKKISFNTKDTASFVADPKFISESKNDYHLKKGSPCIGKSLKEKEGTKKSAELTENIGAF